MHIYFVENGQMDKREFLQLWKEIPEQNELQFSINNNKRLSAGNEAYKYVTLALLLFSFLLTRGHLRADEELGNFYGN